MQGTLNLMYEYTWSTKVVLLMEVIIECKNFDCKEKFTSNENINQNQRKKEQQRRGSYYTSGIYNE